MEVFQSTKVDPFLLEKIITKFEVKSYFRLQQTSRAMYNFVRRSRHISVHLNAFYWLKLNGSPCPLLYLKGNTKQVKRKEFVDVELLYGTRIRKLCIPMDEEFEPLRDLLKKYQISCAKLRLYTFSWTSDDCKILFKLLKPVKIRINSLSYRRYEALPPSEIVQIVKVTMRLDAIDDPEAEIAMEKLFSKFPQTKHVCIVRFGYRRK